LGGLYIDTKYVEAVGDKKMNFEPENLAEYIGHDDPNNPLFYVDEWESDSPQCLMLDGAPGLGKTTAAYLIGKYLELDIVEYNASDERGIDFIRNQLKSASKTATLWNGGRLILLDEADGLTKPAQDSLKRIMEKSNCWWILTCNDNSKIIPAIKSRCVIFSFKPYSVKQISAYQALLLSKTGVASTESPAVLHSQFNGDLRAIGKHILSKKKLELSQSSIDEITLHIAAGDWTNTHKTMLGMIRAGASLHYLMREIQNYVKSVGLTSERLYTFYVVWGDFVIRMNQWPFDEESFVDYFIASLYNADTKNKEE
jgi:replication-associated recombination protein RarA